jgi:hypothetical protein
MNVAVRNSLYSYTLFGLLLWASPSFFALARRFYSALLLILYSSLILTSILSTKTRGSVVSFGTKIDKTPLICVEPAFPTDKMPPIYVGDQNHFGTNDDWHGKAVVPKDYIMRTCAGSGRSRKCW